MTIIHKMDFKTKNLYFWKRKKFNNIAYLKQIITINHISLWRWDSVTVFDLVSHEWKLAWIKEEAVTNQQTKINSKQEENQPMP